MMKYLITVLSFTFYFINPLSAQKESEPFKIWFAGKEYSAVVTETGDTMILAHIDDLDVTFRSWRNDDDYQKYLKMRRYAKVVFPYAKEAIRIFREWEYASQYLSKKEQKKKLKELDEQLTAEFEAPLKKLTKLQGKIMVKMIEKELEKPMHTLIKDLKGGWSAFYWHTFSKLYSYDLKEGYNVGQYPILDMVLEDFDVSHRIESESEFKYVKLDRTKAK